jgi:hypothetical protein
LGYFFHGPVWALIWKKNIGPNFGRIFHKLIWGRCYDHNFCDFCLFLAKKLAFFSKTNVIITIFPKTSSSLAQNANFFAKCFGENILKIITSVLGHPGSRLKQLLRKISRTWKIN